MKKIGITGGIGSGKSTVCRVFSLLGIPVYDSDREARRLMEQDATLREAICQLFGSEAYTATGLNRPLIAQQVFAQPALLTQLNAIVHPAVAADFARWADSQCAPYVMEESAILFEAGADRQMDATIAVTAPEMLRILRTCRRDGSTEKAVRERIRNQMNDEERCARADYTLQADEEQLLIPQILELHRLLLA